MRIAYIGTRYGTSAQRYRALERLGHEVCVVDPFNYLAPWQPLQRLVVKTGALGAGLYAYRGIFRSIERTKPDLIWVDTGALLGPCLIRALRTIGVPVINYMIDNAWSAIYKTKCRHYRAAVPYYDFTVQVRETNIDTAYRSGGRHVFFSTRCADEFAHSPRELTDDQKRKYASDVAFIGTWHSERSAFLAELIHYGVPISIWGDRWNKADEWSTLAPHWRGPPLSDADDYAAAVQSAKICIGLVSAKVVDQDTSRSFEIPSLGSLFCAERTNSHLNLYKDGEEAVFWSTAEECVQHCLALLKDEPRRTAIARRGRERALKNGFFNQQELAKILNEVSRRQRPAQYLALSAKTP